MTNILIEGAGLAGQVLHRELYLKGIPSRLADKAEFPRDKVCGGALQWESWEYLNSRFEISGKARMIPAMNHFWRGKKMSRMVLKRPMVYIPRLVLDDTLNRQQQSVGPDSGPVLRVKADGMPVQKGDWLGFQGTAENADELEMHYGRGIYLGLAPTEEGPAHAAFIVKKKLFRNPENLKEFVKKELGIRLAGPLKGTQALHYHHVSGHPIAVGDAKLATHPFLGLGMKHAILSARLLAHCIASGESGRYPEKHRRLFRKYRWSSRFLGNLYDSPARWMLKAVLRRPGILSKIYQSLHDDEDVQRIIDGRRYINHG